MPSSLSHDVIIAGAGPVGLFLACELRLAGCSVLVLERTPAPAGPGKLSPFGVRGLTPASIEALDRRGLLAPLQACSARSGKAPIPPWAHRDRRAGGHFAGIPFYLDRIDAPLPTAGMVPVLLADLEAVLLARATALGVAIRRECTVDDLRQSADAVSVSAGGEPFRGDWLIGCDGAHSAVRRLAGIGVVGSAPSFTGYSAQFRLADPAALPPGRHCTPTGHYTVTPPDLVTLMEFDSGAGHKLRPITAAHLEAVLHRVTGRPVAIAALARADSWTDRAFRANSYRSGRVLLAGDAAHIHAPLGGQGLNLGLGDAFNLGWKLAAEIGGRAPPGLLDSYAAERQPVADAVLDWSRAQAAVMRPDPGGRALAAIFAELIETRDGASYVAERVWGTGLRYPMDGTHALPGRSAPDLVLPDGARLNRHLRHGRGLLFDSTGNARLQGLCARAEGRVQYLAGAAPDGSGPAAMLVRPDGIVCWACDANGPAGDADAAMARWFGGRTNA